MFLDKNNINLDVLVGGPPCQAYSTAGRVRDSKGMEKDPRNFLFESYVKILEYYQPKFFVFEYSTTIGNELIFIKAQPIPINTLIPI